MADIRGLEEAFAAASEEARRTYDRLNGTGGRGGLEQDYLLAKEKSEKNPDDKTLKQRYSNVKKLYDTAAAEYKRAQDAKNAARLELNRANKTSEKEKGAKDLVDVYNKAVDKVKSAEALIPSRGQAQYDAAVQAAYDAAAAAKAAGGKVSPLPPPATGVKRPEDKTSNAAGDSPEILEEVANNKYKDYTIKSDGSVVAPGGKRIYFVIEKDANGNSEVQQYESVATARDAFLKNYSAPGALDKLKQQLRAKNYISAEQLKTGDWIRGLDDMLGDYTRDAVTAVKYGGAKESPLIDAWFGKAVGGTGTGETSKAGTWKDTGLDLTTVGDAYRDINDYMIDALGREATQEEKAAYYKDLNARELKSAVETVEVRDATGKITKSKRTGDFVTAEEKLNSKNAIVLKALEGTDAGTILKSAKGSQVAVQIGQLQKAAASYGQPISAGEALKYVIEGGTQKDALAKQTERMRLNAMTMYGNLKDHIKDGGNVKDIADQYAMLKAKKLGIPITDAFNDKDVQMALTKDGGLMSTAEFTRHFSVTAIFELRTL